MKKEDIESIEQGYFAALEWLTWGSPDFFELENDYDIDTDKINSLVSDIVKDFIDRVPADLIEQYLEQIKNAQYHALNSLGHDLYLTSEGHGAGFWDRGLGDLGKKLTNYSKSCATIHIWYDGESNTIRGE